jgi:predicted peroxiredoxin
MPGRCVTPFYMAMLASAMENETRMALQMEAVLLMKRGLADDLRAVEGEKPVLEFIREAREAGVEIYCCSGAMQAHGITEADLIEECSGVIGGAWILGQAGEADVFLTY